MKKLVCANVKLTIPWNVLVDEDMPDEDICLKIQEAIFDDLGLEQSADDEDPIIESIWLRDVPEPEDLKEKAEYTFASIHCLKWQRKNILRKPWNKTNSMQR